MLSKLVVFAILISSVIFCSSSVRAEEVCQVTDPTGTPLNVRDRPNGKIINSLKNRREVYIQEISYDNKDRPWAKVGGYDKGAYRTWGWVYREFISCYSRSMQ
ncbi:MAG: SH3 domain-containing protein [Xenococcaceae cyanobacterium]